MPLTKPQIATIQRSASLGQAKLYQKAWGISDQQLADILRNSTIGTLLPNIEQQHIKAGTPVPKQATEFRKLLERHPQETKYDIRGKVKGTMPSISERVGKVEYGAEVKIEQPTIIQATADELRKVADDQAKLAAGETCLGGASSINLYRVTTSKGEDIYVYSLSTKGREGAKQKVKDAGYKVAWVGSIPSSEIPTQPEVATQIVVEREQRDGSIKLDSGEWVSTEKYDNLPKKNQEKLNKLGIDRYNQWLVDEAGKQINTSGSQYLIDAFNSGGIDGYNKAVNEYNQVIKDAHWFDLYNSYKAISDKDWGKDNWEWFQKTYADKLNDKKYMAYLESSGFQNKYADVMQPTSIPDKDWNLIKKFITPIGFDSAGALDAGKDNPAQAAQIIGVTNKFVFSTISDETKAKLNSGEWTLLPYGQIIETDTLERMPPTYRNIVENSGLCGLEDYQEKVHEWNKQESWGKNTLDAIGANALRLGGDIKNFALLELSTGFGKVKEGDPKPVVDPLSPGAVNVGFLSFTAPTVQTYTAEEVAEINAIRADAQKYYKDIYDEAELAAQEWLASRPYLQPVYPEGFVGSIQKDPSSIKDPLLWSETFANTLPYTVATGLIIGGAVGAGPAGVAATAPLAFGITMSVEGHDIYKDAIANGASHERALKLANTYGAISASIETLGDSIFVGAIGHLGGAFSRSLGRNLTGNIIRGAAKKYGWKNLTISMIKDFVNQGGQEFFQEVVHNAAIKTVNENQALLENTANAFVSGVIGTAPFVLVPAGGQAINIAKGKLADVRVERGKAGILTPIDVTPQMQIKILNKVFAPVSGFTVKTTEAEIEHFKKFPTEVMKTNPVEYMINLWEKRGRNVYEAGRSISVGLIDKKTVIAGKAKVDEVALAYAEMCSKVNEYAYTQLKLKQAQKAIADFGLAKSKSELNQLNEYKKRAKEIETKLKELKQPMVESVERFSNTFLKNSVGLEAEQKAEVREMPKTIAMDIDSVTTQLFGERNAKEIAEDIKELEAQIKVIEEEMAKGMTREQLEGYARLISVLKGQVGDLVNELRQRYLSEGEKIKPETKKLTMEVMSLQARLIKAMENLNNFTGSALNYDVYRKGELATKGEVVKMERDTFEAVQRTTETVWGRESYAEVLEKLNSQLSEIIDSMESLKSKKAATKAAFKIYDAIKEEDPKALKEGVKLLQLEAGKTDNPALLQQVKLLETLTTENFWNRFKETEPKKKADVTWYKSDEFESEQNDLIRRDAERIVERRLEELLHPIPDYIQRNWRSGEDMMEYLRKEYDRQYFQDAHLEEFEDVDDYLNVDKVESRLRAEIERQEQLQEMNRKLEIAERERDLAKNLRNKATNPKRRSILDEVIQQRGEDIERQKTKIKVAEKTKLVIPAVKVKETTERVAREEALVPIEKKKETKKERLARLKAEEKAAKRIRIAKQEIAKEEELAKKEERESAFPGIKPKPKEKVQLGYADIEYALAQYYTLAGTKTKVFPKTAVQQAIEAGVQARAAVQTRLATKTQTATQVQTQTQTAVQTAVETALETQTETATEEEIETATKLITEIVTRTKTRPVVTTFWRPPRMEPTKGRQKKIREGPALAVWRQGAYWVSVFPPFRGTKPDVVYSREKPPWGSVIARGRHSPRVTLRSIGKVPELIEVPMGMVIARIRHGKHLSFSRRNGRRRGRVIA